MWNSINIIDQFIEDPSDLIDFHGLASDNAIDCNLSSGSYAHRVKSITSLCEDCAIDRVILHLIRFRGEAFFNHIKDRIKCVETWINFSDSSGKPLGLHLDMDEARFYWDRKESANILNYLPVWSCTIFISPQSTKALSPIVGVPRIVTVRSSVHSMKASLPTYVTDSGRVISVRPQ